ncbi:hypothetical protein LPU83_pLPU83d_1166 (plasmid) [Rhizobium favelukesii]|uniref:Uncharacterized protein n=1 Tax=Rhizobium favelukesii TaxID=348824 RepID=W6S8U3_9HYPH|nr:hypothetical protein LPU83_pLPU83d_1166 [Rhizobium favelukesii]
MRQEPISRRFPFWSLPVWPNQVEIGPVVAKVVGEHEALELAAAQIFEMNRPDRPRCRHLQPPGSQGYGAG